MKTKMQKVIVLIVLVLTANNASAIFAPVPSPAGKSFNLDVGLDPKVYFSPTFALAHLGASASLTYNVWKSLEIGAQIRGGMNDQPNGLFGANSTYTGDLGGDVMVRYLVECCRFYFGAQVQFGYDYFFNSSNTFAKNSYMSLSFGVPVGINFENSAAIYMMPAIELGRRNGTDTGAWGSLISGSIALGTKINLGGPSLIIELAPRVDDFNDMPDTVGLNTFAGVSFDF